MARRIRPLLLATLGCILVTAASVIRFASAQQFPQAATYQWTFSSLLPLFVICITGLIFLLLALLRVGRNKANAVETNADSRK